MRSSNESRGSSVVRRMRVDVGLLLVSAITLSVAACDGGGGGGGGGGGPSANPGDSSGTLQLFATVSCTPLVEDTAGLANCPVFAYISVEDLPDENDVDDATVVVTPWDGEPVTLQSNGNGNYMANFTGYADAYTVDVTRGSDYFTGVVMVSPNDFDVSVDPDPPVVGQAATVHWSPTQGTVNSIVYVQQGFVAQTYSGTAEGDDGVENLPDTAFPAADTYYIEVGRGRLASLDGSGGGFSQGIVLLGKTLTVTVE